MLPCPTCSKNRTGDMVRIAERDWQPGQVTDDKGYVGLDGRHWLSVKIGNWEFNVPCNNTEPVV